MTAKTRPAPRRLTAKRVFRIGIMVIVLFSIFAVFSSALGFHVAFRRWQEPAYNLAMSYTSDDAEGYPRVPVSFPSGDHTLRGYLYGTENRQGLVIVVNGFHATQNGHLGEVFYFLDQGWSVLTYDTTGTGESDGTSVIGLEQFRRDLLAALDFVSETPETENLPLFLYGHSAGGYAVATVCDDPRVSASVCISGFNSAQELMLHLGKKYAGPLAQVGYPYMCLYDHFLFGAEGLLTAEKQLQGAVHPVLVVHGASDDTVPLPVSIYGNCDSVENENVTTMLMEEEFRGEHSTVWLTADAARQLEQLSDYADQMRSRYGSAFPEDVAWQLAENVRCSNVLLRTLDEKFMDEISMFFRSALQT